MSSWVERSEHYQQGANKNIKIKQDGAAGHVITKFYDVVQEKGSGGEPIGNVLLSERGSGQRAAANAAYVGTEGKTHGSEILKIISAANDRNRRNATSH